MCFVFALVFNAALVKYYERNNEREQGLLDTHLNEIVHHGRDVIEQVLEGLVYNQKK